MHGCGGEGGGLVVPVVHLVVEPVEERGVRYPVQVVGHSLLPDEQDHQGEEDVGYSHLSQREVHRTRTYRETYHYHQPLNIKLSPLYTDLVQQNTHMNIICN